MSTKKYVISTLTLGVVSGLVFSAISVLTVQHFNGDQYSQILAGITGGFFGVFLISVVCQILNMRYLEEIEKENKKGE